MVESESDSLMPVLKESSEHASEVKSHAKGTGILHILTLVCFATNCTMMLLVEC
eukprot:m.197515 g.197515  ORF g.197515 m.197515 type:complete len:54 (-) comp18723_c0_seq6:66-227(-)